jgi:hypothetical protein
MFIAFVLAFHGSEVLAQVINGESTYEDNFIHSPPAPPGTPQTENETVKPKRQPQDNRGAMPASPR